MYSKSLRVAGLIAGLGLAVSACGAAATTTTSQRQPGGTPSFAGGGRPPGVSGQIAAVNGSTAQVQDSSSQTAVTWTSSTTFTQQTTLAATDVKVGDCIMANRARPTNFTPGSTPSPVTGSTLDGATVRVIATNGSCPTQGAPSGAPNGGQGGPGGGRGFGGFGVTGVVTATSGGATPTITVTSQRAYGSVAAGGSVSVTTSGSTTYMGTQSTTAAAVKVGECLAATGSADDQGMVQATRISLSDPVNGQCATRGFGGGGFGGGAPAGAPAGGGAGA